MRSKVVLAISLLLGGIFCVSCKDESAPTAENTTTPSDSIVVMSQVRSEKRGVSYNFQISDDANLLGAGVSWFYNWAPTISTDVDKARLRNKMDYFPMAWNGGFDVDAIRNYKKSHPECEYILAYNEPNLTDQANMTPSEAAEKWPILRSLATELNMKIVSPAMNYGTLSGYHDPIVWLDEFFTKVPLSDIDVIALHCYMSSATSLVSYVDRFKKYGKPIWMTEFCAWESTVINVEAQMHFMSEAVSYLECNPNVERYAWFIPRTSGSVDSYPFMQLLTKTTPYALTDLGKVYVNMSSFNKDTYYSQGQQIEAENFSSSNFKESVLVGNWSSPVHFRPTTDVSGGLDVTDLNSNQWLDYLIDITADKNTKLEVRYTSLYNTEGQILIDGREVAKVNFLKTGAENSWKTQTINFTVAKGKHTLRIKDIYGGITLNWIKVTK